LVALAASLSGSGDTEFEKSVGLTEPAGGTGDTAASIMKIC